MEVLETPMIGGLVPSGADPPAKQSADVLTALTLPELFNVADWPHSRTISANDGSVTGDTARVNCVKA
jgi:hypothetical protein